jgi:hypothetical protein
VRSELVSSPSSSSLDAAVARGQVKGIKWLGRSISGIRGILLYIFTSSCNNIPIFVSAKID